MSRRAVSSSVLAVRSAVSRGIADLDGQAVVVACSGGPDSLALAGAAAWCGAKAKVRVSAVVVDHGLQPESHAVSEWAAQTCRDLGVEDVQVIAVSVGRDGGPEAAARSARYAALESAAVAVDAAAILLGHTREDQAETVLLRLARGSGARSLSGMRPVSGPWRRPLLDVPRQVVHQAARDMLEPLARTPWSDPHNDDPVFLRVRVRGLLDQLTDAVGPSAVLGLTRSADLLRDDADALDALAEDAVTTMVVYDSGEWTADCGDLSELPRAVRTRVIRLMCLSAGCLGEDLSMDHVNTVESLVSAWHGQRPISLPGGVLAERAYGRLCLRTPPAHLPG